MRVLNRRMQPKQMCGGYLQMRIKKVKVLHNIPYMKNLLFQRMLSSKAFRTCSPEDVEPPAQMSVEPAVSRRVQNINIQPTQLSGVSPREI